MTRQAEKQLREIRCAVVIRTKDRPRHLLQALKSVQGQIRKPDEVVVVNDGGSSVVDVLSEFEDLLIIPVVHRESLGRAEAGNAGVNASTADAVCFLDDDDRFFPDHLQRLELCMLRFDAKVAYSGSRMVRQDLLGEDEPEQRFFAGEFNDPFDPDRLLFENYIPLNTLMIDRLLFIEVGGFDPSFDLFEDWDLLLRLSLKTRFYHLDRVTSEYAIWGESQQITLASRTDEWRTAYEKFFSRNFLPVKDHEKVVIMADYWMLSQQRRSIIQSQEERIKGLEKELNRLNDLHRTLLDDKSAYETERQIQEEKISALLEDKSAHETERQIQEEKISALHTEIEHLNTCIGQMKQRINDLNQSVPITLSNHDIMNWLLHCRPGNEILPDDPVVKEYNRLAAWVKDQAETQHRTAVSAGDLFRHLKTGLSDLKDQTSFLLNQLHRSKMKKIWRGIPIPQVTEILDKIQSLCRLPEPDSGQTFFPESFLLSLKKSDVQAHINQQEHVNQQVCEDFIPVFEAAAGSGEKSFVFANVSNTPYVHPFALTSEKILCFRLYCDRNNFFCLKFRTATYIRINTCEICVDIFQEDPDRDDVRAEAPGFEPGPIRSCRFNALEAMDNQYYSVLFPSVTDSGGKQFRIAIYSPDASYDNHIALWCRKLDEPPFTPTDHEDPLLCPPVPCQDPIITSLIWDVPLPGMVTAARGKADHIFFMHHDPKPGMSWTHAAAVLMRLNRSAMAASRSIAVEIWGIPDPEVQAYCHQNHIVYHVLEKEDHHENQVLPRFLEQAGKADAEKLIWFSSTDFVPQKDFLENAEAFFREQPDTGLLFFLVKDCSNRVLHAFGQTTCEGCVDLFPWDMPADHPSLGCVRQIDGAGFPWFAMRSDLPCAGDPEDMMDMVLNAYETEVYQVTEWIWRLKVQGISTVFDAGVSFFGETAGFGETPGLPAFEDALHRDRQVFLTRWDPCLISLPNVSSTRSALLNPGKKQRALVVDLTLPTFDEDSGSLRMFELLGLLVQMGLQVTFVPDNRDNSPKYRRPLELMGIEVFTGEYTLSHALEGLEYDMIILSRVNIAHRYMNQVRLINPGARIYYDTVDIHYVRELRQAEIEHNDQLRKNALNTKKMELAACIMADVVFTVTTADKHHLHKELPFLSCFVLPNIYKEMPIPMSWENTEGLVFIGNYNHQPNEDAVYYFVEKVFPLVQKHIPEIKLYLIGSNMKNEMKALASDTIKVLGWVEKVEPELAKRRVMVSSLRYGAGMKGKIGQAMSLGLPVVSTRIGAEGMGIEDEKTVLVADEPEFFAEKECRLYTDKALWENISLNAKNFIFSRYGRESVKQKLEDFIAKDVKSPLYTRLSSFYGRAD